MSKLVEELTPLGDDLFVFTSPFETSFAVVTAASRNSFWTKAAVRVVSASILLDNHRVVVAADVDGDVVASDGGNWQEKQAE